MKKLTVFLTLIIVTTLAFWFTGQARADINGCPTSNTLGNRLVSNLVGASYTINGNDVTYFFDSFVDRNSTDGVPGLIEYCIYPKPATQPDNVVTVAVGANGTLWADPPGFDNFSFNRQFGNPSNIPLNGTEDIEIGTATWNAGAPTEQIIVLHINDAAECDRLYGGNPGTCFVFPGEKQQAQDLVVTKTAAPSFTRTFPWEIDKSVDTNLIKTAGMATFNYTVAVTKGAGIDSGFAISGEITVSNPNDFDVLGVNLSDSTLGGTCTITNGTNLTVPAGGSLSADYTCTFDGNPGNGVNTATATWPDIGSPTTSGVGTANYAFGDPTTVINNEIDVTDTFGGPWHFSDSGFITYAVTFTDPAGTCTDHDNTATIIQTGASDSETVKVCVGADLTVAKTATPFFTRTYGWDLAKDVDKTLVKQSSGLATFNYTVKAWQTGFTDSDWRIDGIITVSNPNDWEAVTVNLGDDIPTCVLDQTTFSVPALDSVQVGYTCNFTAGLDGLNTATAAWDKDAYYTPNGSASGSASFAFVTPTTTINKVITISDTFDGSATLLGTLTATDSEPFASITYTYAHTVNDPAGTCTKHNNLAEIIETGKTDGETVEVCVGADLTVVKTATPFFTRTYSWDITKDVDKTLVKQVGGTATFNYTVNAWQTGFTDSDWRVDGIITVSNPNDWQAVVVSLSDNIPACVLAQTSFSVPALGSVEVGYTCAFTAGLDGVNTATITWDKEAYYTPGETASGSASFAFVTPTTTVNKVVTITDTFNGTTNTLGTLTAADAQPYTSGTFTYSRIIPVPAYNCLDYTNTAVIVETGQQDSETVRVCGPMRTGALTIGFWQNKNGQGIIKNYCQGTSGTSLYAFLTSFNPYKDLTKTACTDIAAYVTNIIKTANAAGASMNAMLKAQMLATTLNVYFSDPALGGNRINAPAAIGGLEVDLTMICTDMTCTSFQNSSGAFGGTPKTILEMLEYASSRSNIGGTLWYNNYKPMQEKAKDAFDAINNRKVFAP